MTMSRTSHPAPGYLEDDAPAPASVLLQLGALQALCRQTVAVRLALILIGTPFALANTDQEGPRYAAVAAAVLGVTTSYAVLRDWNRVGPRLLAHPTLMALDLLFVATLLLTASPASPLAYATVCTPLLSGLLYGWRGAGVLTGLQLAVVLSVFRAWEHHPGAATSTLLIAGFCAAAGVIGVTLRNLMFRIGVAGEALSQANARLAAAEAVEAERARLAREMHDSVAKTLHGLALAAQALAASADHGDPDTLKRQATLVAGAARRAAAESRAVLCDLRRRTGVTPAHLDLADELTLLTQDFADRTGATVALRKPDAPLLLPYTTAQHVLAIASEALENTHRHARASRIHIALEAPRNAVLDLRVGDNGVGLPPSTTPDGLAKTGHFGLLGMTERAASLGGHLSLGRSPLGGAEIHLHLPLPATASPAPQEEAAHA
ncbi:sensor histidine kinase [Streptomyces sp. Ru72]|uniref:sensor histidine kinase n=1 Tax=Streptomyces sp. Ru72 TaxID=2080747 RepID=UPI000CDD3FCC|nr:histidine kinase [Streptomyces sp. Ru72]POX52983.1 two-component sensor histidine kinase [Streptomyces sp. Ru72]